MVRSLIVLASFLAWFVSSGHTLKCYTCDLFGANCSIPATCEHTGSQPPFERCLRVRVTSKVPSRNYELRRCELVVGCNKQFLCRNVKEDETCLAGCCQGDLCNSESFVPSTEPPKTFEPSGSNLSCYSCMDLPVKNNSMFKTPRSCSQYPQHVERCSDVVRYDTLTIKQDRCLTLKLQVREESGGIKEMLIRNCSDAFGCAYSNALWLYAFNQSAIVSAQGSCCSGNRCETGASNTTPSPNSSATTSLFYSSILVVIVPINLISFI